MSCLTSCVCPAGKGRTFYSASANFCYHQRKCYKWGLKYLKISRGCAKFNSRHLSYIAQWRPSSPDLIYLSGNRKTGILHTTRLSRVEWTGHHCNGDNFSISKLPCLYCLQLEKLFLDSFRVNYVILLVLVQTKLFQYLHFNSTLLLTHVKKNLSVISKQIFFGCSQLFGKPLKKLCEFCECRVWFCESR